MAEGRLFILPINISESPLERVLPDYNRYIVNDLRFFIVEKVKTSRQFLRKMNREFPIDDSQFIELDKHNDYSFPDNGLEALKNGQDIGLMSESGYPGIADPGAKIVSKAHELGIRVIPLIGPNSIFLALASSGMNGNGFTFNGYLPIKDPERGRQVKGIVGAIRGNGYAQIFIETPYRNENLFKDFMQNCPTELKLCVAYDVTGQKQKIITKTIGEWKSNKFIFDKTPCVFILGN